MPNIRGLTLWEPWATLIALGEKRYETRRWRRAWRGWLAIHASKKWNAELTAQCLEEPYRTALAGYGINRSFPLGCIVAVAQVVGYIETTRAHISDKERAFGDWSPDRWGWKLSNVVRLDEPIPCRGSQGLWVVPDEIVAQLPLEVTV